MCLADPVLSPCNPHSKHLKKSQHNTTFFSTQHQRSHKNQQGSATAGAESGPSASGASGLFGAGGPSATGPSAAAASAASASAPRRRLVVFVAGGVTRGEMRAAHQAARALGRDVVLASTAVLTPAEFCAQLARLGLGAPGAGGGAGPLAAGAPGGGGGGGGGLGYYA